MELLRRHLFFIICGLVAIAGIVLGAFGITKMSEVHTGMQEAVTLHDRLRTHMRNPVNKKGIDAEQQRINAITKYHEGVIQLADQYAVHPQLVENFFPRPDPYAKLPFSGEYRKALDALHARLKAGTIPTEHEIEDEAARMREEKTVDTDATFGVDVQEARRSGELLTPAEEEPEPTNPSGLITDEQAGKDAYVRASISKAKRIYCYATLPSDPEGFSFHIIDDVYNMTGFPPTDKVFWDAQLSLWAQQDVTDALARVNEQAAERLKAEGRSPWVGNLPVKDLISLRVSDYVRGEETQDSPNELVPAHTVAPIRVASAAATPSFTGNVSNDEYELIHFTLEAVVDARDLPLVITEICNNKFTTLFRVQYEVEPPNLRMEGKIYGGEPVVRASMEFETLFFSKLYLPIMPDVVLAELGKKRPEPTEGG